MKVESANRIIICDATTGEHLRTIKIEEWSMTTIETMIKDILATDLCYKQHGLHITYAIS